ncbi:MFS-type transporter SLC18B1-like [Anneissia japonica]|uniref:MFS-type transporter SLC18B1-like n=1 Tax=Anneissia japonica TaxID=1529436 RepID=UPI001425BB8D|nr:MFS-type transporter SLC18B1-like [Anneissia japonica]
MVEKGESVDIHSKVSVQEHSNEEEGQEENPKFTKRQILTFISLSLANFFDCSSFSLIAPIYPKEAEDNGVGSTVIGLIFGSFSFVMFIVSPICGKILPKVGAKFMFLSGEFLCAGANIIFGFLNKMDNKTQFVVFSFVVRGVGAAGAAAAVTAMFAIIANTFPGNVAKMIGMLEVFSGLGFMLGPLIGGVLDQAGGFSLPFLAVGVAVIAIIIINVFLLPNDDVKPKELGSYRELWRIPAVWFTSLAILTGSLALGFLDPTLADHLHDIDPKLNPTQTGACFLLVGGVYALTSPFWGWLADKENATRPMIVGGFLAAFVSYLLIGPSPLIHLPKELWVICLGLGFLGVSIGCGLTPTFQDMLVSSRWYGMSDDLPTHSLVSGHFNSMFSIGTFAGPVLGGFLVDNLTFKWAATIFSGLSLGLCVVFTIFNLWEFRCFKGRRPPSRSSSSVLIVSDDETAPLLGAKS